MMVMWQCLDHVEKKSVFIQVPGYKDKHGVFETSFQHSVDSSGKFQKHERWAVIVFRTESLTSDNHSLGEVTERT